MLKITVDGDYGTFEFEGSNFDMALEIVMEQEMHE